jgi:peptidoglycan/LPS O-acetylase OafA/YrhL
LVFIVAGAASSNSMIGKYKVPGAYVVATLAYSLYLTHKSVYHLVHTTIEPQLNNNGYVAFFVYALAVLLVASLLYVVVERPFLKLRVKFFAWDNGKLKEVG